MRDNDMVAAAQQQVRDANQFEHDAQQIMSNAQRLADESASKQINQGIQVSSFSYWVSTYLCWFTIFHDPTIHKKVLEFVTFYLVSYIVCFSLYCFFIAEVFIDFGYECDRHFKINADAWRSSTLGSVSY